MKKKFGAVGVLVALAATVTILAVGIGSGSAAKSAPYKVAWIYVGPHNDHGWSQAHDEGRAYVQKMLGGKVQTTYKETIANGPQLQQTVASLVQQGYKLIFGDVLRLLRQEAGREVPRRQVRAGDGYG